MEKEKAKGQAGQSRSIRRLLIAAVCIVSMMAVAVILRPLTYQSRTLPDEQRYRPTGDSYLTRFPEYRQRIDIGEFRNTESVRRTVYALGKNPMRGAKVEFVYYDARDFAQQLYAYKAAGFNAWIREIIDPEFVKVSGLSADDYMVVCNFFHGPEHNCSFIALYGSCVIDAYSYVLEPLVSADDYKQLIEDYIDPQMAAWDVCYGREPAKSPEP